MITLIQLECFIAVAEELHFSAAAERLRMTQPPLTRQIQALERELGVLLLNRTSRRVTLTSAGQHLLHSARHVLDIVTKVSTDVRRIAAGVSGTVTISYTSMAAQSALPSLLSKVSEELPEVSLVLREMVSIDQATAITNGTVDIGLLRPNVLRPEMGSQLVLSEKLVAAVPAQHRLAQGDKPVEIKEFSGEKILMYSPSEARYFHDLMLKMFAAADAMPTIVQYAGQVPALLAFVEAGLGITMVPQSAQRFGREGIVFRELARSSAEEELNQIRMYGAWHKETTNPAVFRILEILERTTPRRSED